MGKISYLPVNHQKVERFTKSPDTVRNRAGKNANGAQEIAHERAKQENRNMPQKGTKSIAD